MSDQSGVHRARQRPRPSTMVGSLDRSAKDQGGRSHRTQLSGSLSLGAQRSSARRCPGGSTPVQIRVPGYATQETRVPRVVPVCALAPPFCQVDLSMDPSLIFATKSERACACVRASKHDNEPSSGRAGFQSQVNLGDRLPAGEGVRPNSLQTSDDAKGGDWRLPHAASAESATN